MGHRPFLKKIDHQIKRPDLKNYDKAVFILHDQLNLGVWPDWIRQKNPLLIFMEARQKGLELPHHQKKAVYVLSAMRHFALDCHNNGFSVLYHATNGHFDDGLEQIIRDHSHLSLWYMTPSEWDSRQRLQQVKEQFSDRVHEISNGFFFADPAEWTSKIGEGYRMEYFYRDMRKKTGYLMKNDEPVGNQWNFDEENRKPLPQNHTIPSVGRFEPDAITSEVKQMVEEYFPDHFGSSENFGYAVTRDQALDFLNEFIRDRLKDFGPYEDAMADGKVTVFHSGLSLYLNNGLLLPWEVCDRVEKAYREGKAPLNSVEGFIRQVIGWREFVRIYYEAMMPEVREANFMNFSEPLPELYWSADTNMRCLQQSLKPVVEQGYSHHIQRLMVLSNFSNLTKTDPRALNRWFWLAYVDAYEWVVLPNVLGMSTFADGGVLASKPYVSSGNYINKMSNYCASCAYSVTKKTGEGACPFNYLYWNFVDEQRDAFQASGRNSFMVNMYDKKSREDKKSIQESTSLFLEKLDRN